MNFMKWKYLSWSFGIVGAVLVIVCFCFSSFWQNPLAYVGMLFLVGAVVLDFAKCRCPHCGRHISENSSLVTNECPHCKKALKE